MTVSVDLMIVRLNTFTRGHCLVTSEIVAILA